MDSSQSMRKLAFDAWWKETTGVRNRNNDYEAWQAACKWQREKDADIVRDYRTTCGLPGWKKLFDGAADRLEEAIRND